MGIFKKKKATTTKKESTKSVEKVEVAPKVYDQIKNKGLAFNVLIKPLVSEKSTELANKGVYVFSVYPNTNKIEIAKAIADQYNVKVEKVNILKTPSKMKAYGRTFGRRTGIKKAMIKLAKGQKIQVFEGV
jgi:large subunit ribosomal protein L23